MHNFAHVAALRSVWSKYRSQPGYVWIGFGSYLFSVGMTCFVFGLDLDLVDGEGGNVRGLTSTLKSERHPPSRCHHVKT